MKRSGRTAQPPPPQGRAEPRRPRPADRPFDLGRLLGLGRASRPGGRLGGHRRRGGSHRRHGRLGRYGHLVCVFVSDHGLPGPLTSPRAACSRLAGEMSNELRWSMRWKTGSVRTPLQSMSYRARDSHYSLRRPGDTPCAHSVMGGRCGPRDRCGTPSPPCCRDARREEGPGRASQSISDARRGTEAAQEPAAALCSSTRCRMAPKTSLRFSSRLGLSTTGTSSAAARPTMYFWMRRIWAKWSR